MSFPSLFQSEYVVRVDAPLTIVAGRIEDYILRRARGTNRPSVIETGESFGKWKVFLTTSRLFTRKPHLSGWNFILRLGLREENAVRPISEGDGLEIIVLPLRPDKTELRIRLLSTLATNETWRLMLSIGEVWEETRPGIAEAFERLYRFRTSRPEPAPWIDPSEFSRKLAPIPDDVQGRNLEMVEMWRNGETARRIGESFHLEEKTVFNRLGDLRTKFGPEVVPYHNHHPILNEE